MKRKILWGAAALLLPITTVGVVIGTTGTASAHFTPNIGTAGFTCDLNASVAFASPGLSLNGSLSTKSTSQTDIDTFPGAGGAGDGWNDLSSCANTGTGSGYNLGATGTGTPSTLKINATNPYTCSSSTYAAGGGYLDCSYYVYDSLEGGALYGLLWTPHWQATHTGDLAVHIAGTPATTIDVTVTGGAAITSGGACGESVGYQIKGNVTGPASLGNGHTASLLLCFTTDTATGPDVTGSGFAADLGAMAASAQGGVVITNAAIGSPSTFTVTP